MKPPPKTLNAEAKKWWTKILEEFEIEDGPGLLLLQTALESFTRMRQSQEAIRKHGLYIKDKFKQLKINPATVVERDSKSQMLQALKQLNLDLEPLKNVGRPGGK